MDNSPQPSAAALRILSLREGARPTYIADLNGRPVRIELQSSAILALAGKTSGDVHLLLERKRHVVQAAAQQLYEKGYYSETGDGLEIHVTALDF